MSLRIVMNRNNKTYQNDFKIIDIFVNYNTVTSKLIVCHIYLNVEILQFII